MAVQAESAAEGKKYIVNQIKEKVAQKNINIKKLEWRITSKGEHNLQIRTNDRIVDKKFKKEELLYFQTKTQFKVAMKIESIVLKLTK